VLLTTFRKNGLGVPTAMWFAQEQGKLYMVTGRNSGKIKRIRNSERVLLAPCDMMGHVLGPQIEACAHELHADQHAHANAVLARKYGDEYEIDVSEGNVGNEEETFIEIDPVQERYSS
jgi:PPOX class probable F420-dependent enzyme